MGLRHLVIVIPGIGGSVLRPSDGPGVQWDLSKRSVVRALLRPERLSVDQVPVLEPVRLIEDLTIVRGLTVMPGYGGLVRSLETTFATKSGILRTDGVADPDAEVLLFPYDFRTGVKDAAERLAVAVRARLGPEGEVSGRPVIVVAHSMGGLVARYWLGPLGGWRRCTALVTLGTPHRGAPKALDWLFNGVRFGRLWKEASAALRGWQSVYDLLPRYEAIQDAAGGGTLRPAELPAGVVEDAGLLAGSVGAVLRGARAGAGMHADIEAGWAQIPEGQAPRVHAVFARHHATPARATLVGGRVRVVKDDAVWLPGAAGWPGGDGTVPAISAVPIELADDVSVRRTVSQRHGPMGSSALAAEIVAEYAAPSTSAIRGPGDPPVVGVDLEPFATVGAAVPVAAWLRNAEADERTRLWALVRPAAGGPWTKVALESDAGGVWRGTLLPDPGAGTYQVRVEAVGVPRSAPAPVTDLLDVVDPADDDEVPA